MEITKPTLLDKLSKTFQINNKQLAFGSYAAELSFFVIWSIFPLMLALANVIAILPLNDTEILSSMKSAMPADVAKVLLPIVEMNLKSTSTSLFSLGLIISLWPASNVYNTLQRIFNQIYKVTTQKNFIITRIFAYFSTFLAVIVIMAFTFLMLFGETIYNFVKENFNIKLVFLDFIASQGWIFGLIGLFFLLVLMYYAIPNVKWPIKYALPGAVFAVIGFALVSKLFGLYMSYAGNKATGNSTIGVLIVVMIWLYFNGMVLAIGAYLNVFWHDFNEKAYWKLEAETRKYQSYLAKSDHFVTDSIHRPSLRNKVYKSSKD